MALRLRMLANVAYDAHALAQQRLVDLVCVWTAQALGGGYRISTLLHACKDLHSRRSTRCMLLEPAAGSLVVRRLVPMPTASASSAV